jgi:glycosyltransferase involved in cell wall biosynthesis
MGRYVRLLFLGIYHFLVHVLLLLLLIITFFLPKKKNKQQNNDIIVLSSVAISYDGRIQKSLLKLEEYFSNVFLVKPKDAAEDLKILAKFDSKNLKILLRGRAGSYSYIPYCFDLSVFLYIFFSKSSYIYCHDISTCLMGFLVSKLRGKILIADLHEWMSETVEISKIGHVSNLPFYKKTLFESIERVTLKHADHVITVSEMLSQLIKEKYNIKRIIIIVKNTGSILENKKIEKIEKLKSSCKGINLLYFGQIQAHRNIENLIYGLLNCKGFNLWIQGTCPEEYKNKLSTIIAGLNLNDRITFLPPVSPSEIINAIKKADVGIMSCKTFSKNLKNSLPNKVFEYIYAEIPFICEDLPAVKSLVGTPSFIKYFDSNLPGSFMSTLKSVDNKFLNSDGEIKEFKEKLFYYDDFDKYAMLKK